jgi:GNAT superfamily N-acetyltransferase
MGIAYAVEPDLGAGEFIAVLQDSGLAARRPVGEPERINRMLRAADIIVTARDADRLVGVSRAIADFAYCCYLSDLAVARSHQRRGIGKRLIDETWDAAGRDSTLILLAAPAAVDYYPHIGMSRHDACFVLPRRM